MSDPNPRGGNLFDMAKEGTKGTSFPPFPSEAAQPNVVPSTGPQTKKKGLETTAAGDTGIADNTLGSTALGEVVSAAGGELPEDVGGKYSRSGGKERGEHGEPGEHHHHHAPHGGRNLPSH
ncbi:hypothetical protein VTI74DRAFT_10650 [Chaetomium olivicolor]